MSSVATSISKAREGIVGLFCLFGVLYFIQGVNETATGLVNQPFLSLLKRWGSSPSQITSYVALLGLPWCLKPLFGLASDFIRFAGYRRKSYLIAAGFASTVCFLGLYLLPLSADLRGLLLVGLFVPTVAVTFADVVLDALIIEIGQPREITGRLQSVRWGASYAATILTGFLGGKLCQSNQHRLAFLICGALAAAGLFLAIMMVREPRAVEVEEDLPSLKSALIESLRSRAVIVTGLFLFVWHFNPFTQAVLYLHVTKTMNFSQSLSEELYGQSMSMLAIGSVLACACYGVYCRRVPMRRLAPLSVVMGIASNMVYWLLTGQKSLEIVSVVVGFTYMTANMIQCDLAARACPVRAAGTIFGAFMAVCNISTLLSIWVGGGMYQLAVDRWGGMQAFQLMLLMGSGFMAASWLVARLLPKELLAK
ncbi:MAG TPA: MFS transporter [Pirellulales bacterium]|nr:MFS transporter [Pirellulales bacterium]